MFQKSMNSKRTHCARLLIVCPCTLLLLLFFLPAGPDRFFSIAGTLTSGESISPAKQLVDKLQPSGDGVVLSRGIEKTADLPPEALPPWVQSTLLQAILFVSFTLVLIVLLRQIFRRRTQELRRRNEELFRVKEQLEQEISARKKREQELRESEQRYFSLFANNHSVMLIIDPETGNIIDANPAACHYYGYTVDEITSLNISDINRLSREQVFQEMARAKSEKRNHFFFRHRLADGEIRDVEVYSGPIALQGRQLLYSIIHDITERKRAEAALRQSKEEWDRTFNSFTDVVILTDLELRIRKANHAACTTLGMSEEEVLGVHCYTLFHDREEPCSNCPVQQASKDIQAYTREIHHGTLNRTFMVSAAPVFDDQGRVEFIAHVAKDITEIKQLEEKLVQAQKMEAIGTLAGGIAHDFNNILSAIIGFAVLARQNVSPDSQAAEDIDKIIVSGKRATDLVKQILTFSRKSRYNPLPLQPHIIIREALTMLRSTLPASITIEEDIDPDCGTIEADPTHLHQIIVNLCTNALQAMENEKGVLRISLHRRRITETELVGESGVSAGAFVVLTVSDSGCGIEPGIIDRIFEPYFTTRETGKGTGLGLAVLHGIVQSYNGFIRVESTPGQGSTFAVHLPALSGEEQKPTDIRDEEAEEKTGPLSGSEHILVVDDEPLLIRASERMLEFYGYRVTSVTDSREALEKIGRDPDRFDLLITDQTMPGLTGAELARAILEIRPTMPIILCTGHSSVVSRDQAMAMGISQYITKPIIGDTLVRLVRQVLDGNDQAGTRQG